MVIMSRYYSKERLYSELLPSIYRQREAESKNKLVEALLGIIANQVGILEDNIKNLYDDWFIETCDEWVIPYIADLLGVKPFHSKTEEFISQRALVANTIRYRQRKGTINTLEQIAHDITGWGAKAIEFFKLLNTTTNVNHVTSRISGTADLRDVNKTIFLETPFEGYAHTAEIRSIAKKQGYYNIKNVGIFLWRLKSFPVIDCPAYNHGNGRFSFSQLGNDVQLFSAPTQEQNLVDLSRGEENNYENEEDTTSLQEQGVPGIAMPLSRQYLSKKLKQYYSVYRYGDININSKKSTGITLLLDIDQEELKKINSNQKEDMRIEDIFNLTQISDLSNWTTTTISPSAASPTTAATTATKNQDIKLLIDPKLGRMLFLGGLNPKRVNVSYYYGFSDNIGGGFYQRKQTYSSHNFYSPFSSSSSSYSSSSSSSLIGGSGNDPAVANISRTNRHYPISKRNALGNSQNKVYNRKKNIVFDNRLISSSTRYSASIYQAIKKWESDGKPNAIFEILDSDVYHEDLYLELNPECNMKICSTEGQRAIIVGSVNILAKAGGSVTFEGIIFDKGDSNNNNHYGRNGQQKRNTKEVAQYSYQNNNSTSYRSDNTKLKLISIAKEGSLGSLIFSHCTLVPRGNTSIFVDGGNDKLAVIIDKSITGKINSANSESKLNISNSIIDAKEEAIVFQHFDNSAEKLKYLLKEHDYALDCDIISNIENSTVFGKVNSIIIDQASNTIFTEPVTVMRRQRGFLRYCYIPSGSSVPQTYSCKQGAYITTTTNKSALTPTTSNNLKDNDSNNSGSNSSSTNNNDKNINNANLANDDRAKEKTDILPLFTSEIYGQPGYCQLKDETPPEISQGADNGSQMGVFNSLYESQKLKMVSDFLQEYLRFGLELGIFTVT